MTLHHIIIAAAEEAAAAHASGGVAGTLGLDWKLFLAQLVNFGIILFIFWKWIVKPLGETLTKRQEKIESGLKNAELMERERKNFDIWKTEEMKKVRQEAEQVLNTATDTAAKIKEDLLGDAQSRANKLLDQTHAQIEADKQNMLKEVRQEVATLVVAATEKFLHQRLDGKKDQELIKESINSSK